MGKVCEDEKYGLGFFQRWNELVHEIVPKEQLLVFETGKHGFTEIAKFLGLEVPKDLHTGKPLDYPRTNSAAEFQFIINLYRLFAVLTVLGFLAAMLVARSVYRSLTGKRNGGLSVKEKE